MKSLIFSLFAFGVQITAGNVTLVQTCPETEAGWDYRSSMFTCENRNMKYHCVLTNIWNLVEVCITPLNTTGNEEGCPSVYIFESSAYWIFPFTPCPIQNTECPQKGHRGYSSEELFKYPSCFRNISERTSGGNESRQTTTRTRVTTSNDVRDEFYRSDVNYIPYTFTALFLLLIVFFIIIFLQNWRNRIHLKEVKFVMGEKKKGSSDISTASWNSSFYFDIKDSIMEKDKSSLEVHDTGIKWLACEDTANHKPKPKRMESNKTIASLEVPVVENIYTNFEDIPTVALEVPVEDNIYGNFEVKPTVALEVPVEDNIYGNFEDIPTVALEVPVEENIYTNFEVKPTVALKVPVEENIYTNFEGTPNHKHKRKNADRADINWTLPG